MRIKCCCLTCIVGEDQVEEAEEERLLEDDKEIESVVSPRKVNSPTLTDAEVKHDSEDNAHKAADILQKNRVELSPKGKNPETVRRAVGILKKYKLSSKQDGSDSDQASSMFNVDLKISIKIMAKSDSVKIFVIEACNVMSVIREKASNSEAVKSSEERGMSIDELLLVQVRTKLLPTEIRGHSKKYEVYEGLTGTMKFSNECIHTLSVSEFLNRKVRFRFYNVFKQKRDILLGEYILDTAALNLEIENGTTSILLHLHEPDCTFVLPPEKSETRRMLSSSSGTGSSGQSSVSSNKSLKSTIRRGDVKPNPRRGIPFFSQSSETDLESKPQAVGQSHLHTVDESTESQNKERAPDSPFQHMMKGVNERTVNVERLQSASEDMANEASAFSDMSSRLREKYQKKASKRKPK